MCDISPRTPNYAELFDLATEQHGYFTVDQARTRGFTRQLLSHHARTGRFRRVRRGLYRFRDYPPSPREEVVAAWLAVGRDRAVVSHESALDLLDLADVIPDRVHLIVPRSMRYVRSEPGIVIHTVAEPLRREEVIVREGVRATAPLRTILDTAEVGVAPEQVERAVRQALSLGLVTADQLTEGARGRAGRVVNLVAAALIHTITIRR